MSEYISENWKKWLKTLISHFIGAGATAAAAYFTDPKDFNLFGGGFEKLGTVFVTAGVMNVIFYLKQSPIPTE